MTAAKQLADRPRLVRAQVLLRELVALIPSGGAALSSRDFHPVNGTKAKTETNLDKLQFSKFGRCLPMFTASARNSSAARSYTA